MTRIKIFFITLLGFFILGLLIPQDLQMPVKGANSRDYNSKSFWAEPWGNSDTHKGVDIFAKKGTEIRSATHGIILLTGDYYPAGKFIVSLGPKWRFHYYAHLDKITTKLFSFVSKNTILGTVGNTGNANNTPSHLHYVIATPLPYFWKKDSTTDGWMKMFILNPIPYLKSYEKAVESKISQKNY
jgi:peptidoglycan LD-endopeptidase LytH